jgi:hypothetical protein
MAWDHAFKMQTSININIFMASCDIKDAIHIMEMEPIKASLGEGACLSRLQNIAEATSPVRNKKGEQKLVTLVYCESKQILYFPPKTYCCSTFSRQRPVVHCLYNILVQAEVA